MCRERGVPEGGQREDEHEGEASVIAITSGSSRDHREDMKQWMLALATTHEGDGPVFLRTLTGNSSENVSLASAAEALHEHVHAPEEELRFFVAESGVSSDATISRFNEAKVRWISRVPETSTEAKAMVETAVESTDWQDTADGQTHWWTRTLSLTQGEARWVMVRTEQGEARAHAPRTRQVEKAEHTWTHKRWHLATQRVACEADAQRAWMRERKGLPVWVDVQSAFVRVPHHPGKGRPKKEATPPLPWQITSTVSVNQPRAEPLARREARFIVATNVLEAAVLSEQEGVGIDKEQGRVARGCRFLNDPLFLASSVFVTKPERIGALGWIMVLCVLVSRLADHRVRTRLAETEHTLPDQRHLPTVRPTMRWIFPCCEGSELLPIHAALDTRVLVFRVQPMHRLVLSVLGPPSENIDKASS